MGLPDAPSRFYRQHCLERGILDARIGDGACGLQKVLAVEQQTVGGGDVLCGHVALRWARFVELEAHESQRTVVQYGSHQLLHIECRADRAEIGRAPLL